MSSALCLACNGPFILFLDQLFFFGLQVSLGFCPSVLNPGCLSAYTFYFTSSLYSYRSSTPRAPARRCPAGFGACTQGCTVADSAAFAAQLL